ncbi:CaiB/BaiF CoA transferase family protein [Bacillus dakarensis]|uniref:CaiB/BaiF CoA transferase family protein n=1 Tax=Robertmurraya dakarensis TaxID=1926278 RepID=UPI000980D6F1|nr:CaiB/BaiF CoA-transferase family protein [Bacillus dakarensis]
MLEGIRILDFSQYLPGPHATLRLVDMGAEVIKVESPQGDPSRPSTNKKGDGLVFNTQNRNKKSIVLNLKEEDDRQIALNLIRDADVVLEGFRPGVVARLGISYEDVIKVKEDIIYCSLSGYGQTGPLSQLGGHDINYLSWSGTLAQFKDQTGRPVQPSTTIADFVGGISASEAILAALVKKLRTGEGSYIDLSITDTLLSLMSNHVVHESITGEEHGIPRLNNKHVCYYIYETKDGRYVSLGALEPKFWTNLCTALNKLSWIPDHFSLAEPNNPVFEELKDMFSSRTLEEWTKFAQEVDCCLAPVLETSEVHQQPLFTEREMIVEKDGIRQISTRFSPAQDIKTHSVPPGLGQHTVEFKEKYENKVY